jgi:hypothetical protein
MLATQPPATSIVTGSDSLVETGAPVSCVNCGRALLGPYCMACGEQRASDRDNSFWGFAKEGLQTFTSADRSFLSSLKVLLSQPGELTADYMRGRRVGLMRPLQLFLLVNVAYFLFATALHSGLFATTLYNQMHNTWHSGMATQMVRQRLGKGNASLEAYEARLASYHTKFDAATTVQAKTLIFTMVPAFALLVGLLHLGRRRFVVEHLVFALHFYSAFLLFAVLITFLLAIPMALVDWVMHTSALNDPLVDPLFGVVGAALLFWYLRRALGRTYNDGFGFSIIGAGLLTAGTVLILFGYRTLLFLTTFWAT